MIDPISASSIPDRSVVMVGMPGAGKTAVGRRLAARLGLAFVDSDHEIEAAADMKISEIFERHGETEFRQLERRVLKRLLAADKMVISTGGGAFLTEETRALIRARAVSVCLTADIAVLLERVGRNADRPLLRGGDPLARLQELLTARMPVYSLADLSIESDRRPIDDTVTRVLNALQAHQPQPLISEIQE